MADQALFDEPAAPVAPVPDPAPAPAPVEETPPQPDLFADQLLGIKDDAGRPKYDTVPKALDALGNSQAHISTLEGEAKAKDTEIIQLREQVAKSEAVDDVVERLTARNEQVQETPQSKGLDQEAVVGLVRKALNAERNDAVKANNLNSVYDSLGEKFGDKARDVIAEKVTELGTTVGQLKTLASENPSLVLALFDGAKPASSTPTSSTLRFPTGTPKEDGLQPPEKSMLSGVTSKEQAAYMEEIRKDTYKKLGVEEN